MQRHELIAWLGDNHGLTGEQVTELLATATDIEARYPDEDDSDDRAIALTVAHRVMVERPDHVVSDVADKLWRARLAESEALVGLRQLAGMLVREGGRGVESEAGFARTASLNRMTVREWLGKR